MYNIAQEYDYAVYVSRHTDNIDTQRAHE